MERVVVLGAINYNEVYERHKDTSVVINDLKLDTEEDRKIIDNLVMTSYDSQELLSAIPTCTCGELTGGFNLGKECGDCGTKVQRPTMGEVDHNVWLRIPDEVHGFISPYFYNLLYERTGTKRYSILEWAIDPYATPPDNLSQVMQRGIEYLQEIGWKRDINYFIENFDVFIEALPKLTNKPLKHTLSVIQAEGTKEKLFPKYLPVPSRLLMVMEHTSIRSFTDLPNSDMMDAVRAISSIANTPDMTKKLIVRRTTSIIKSIASYFDKTTKANFRKKSGLLRGQTFSSRSNFCSRTVIISNHKEHHYNEVLIPWSVGLEVYKFHITNKLLKRGFSLRAAMSLIERSGRTYNETISEILDELIAEAPGQVLPVLMQRNPTIRYNSAQLTKIARFKKDPRDQTINWPPECLRGPNADFDGDETNHQHVLDNQTARDLQILEPHFAIYSFSDLSRYNHCLEIPATTVSVYANMVNSTLDPEIVKLNEEL